MAQQSVNGVEEKHKDEFSSQWVGEWVSGGGLRERESERECPCRQSTSCRVEEEVIMQRGQGPRGLPDWLSDWRYTSVIGKEKRGTLDLFARVWVCMGRTGNIIFSREAKALYYDRYILRYYTKAECTGTYYILGDISHCWVGWELGLQFAIWDLIFNYYRQSKIR